MENFFIDDRFYYNIEDLIEYLELNEEEELKNLPDDYEQEAIEGSLEAVFTLTKDWIVDTIIQRTDQFEGRFPDPIDDDDEKTFNAIKNAIKESIDIDKLNSLIPKLWYGNGKKFKITKKDLLAYCD